MLAGVVLIDMSGSTNPAAASWPNGDLWRRNVRKTSHTTLAPIHVDIGRYIYPFRNVVVIDVSNPQSWL